jgi:hypothetical protein
MPSVNELLDRAKAESSNLLPAKYFWLVTCLRDMNGIGFHEVIDCSLAPYFSTLLK